MGREGPGTSCDEEERRTYRHVRRARPSKTLPPTAFAMPTRCGPSSALLPTDVGVKGSLDPRTDFHGFDATFIPGEHQTASLVTLFDQVGTPRQAMCCAVS
jgi:hypothetical protein